MRFLAFLLLFQMAYGEILDSPVVISLGRKIERYEETFKLMEQAGFTNIQRFEAVDGQATGEDFFKKLNIIDHRPGRRACAASHLTLWKKFLEESEREYLFICEDDMLPHSEFSTLFPIYWKETPKDFDLVLVGNKFFKEMEGEELIVSVPAIALHAYIVSKRGAQILVDNYSKIPKGSTTSDYIIDNFVVRMMSDNKIVYYCYNGKKYPDPVTLPLIQKKYDTGICFQNNKFESNIDKPKSWIVRWLKTIKAYFQT